MSDPHPDTNITRLGRMLVEIFPEELIRLREEIQYHPDLCAILVTQEYKSDMYVVIAETASFLGIILDATYTYEDILKLMDLMTAQLRQRRTLVITLPGHA